MSEPVIRDLSGTRINRPSPAEAVTELGQEGYPVRVRTYATEFWIAWWCMVGSVFWLGLAWLMGWV